jgi:Xaa-Pro aminopeptidase
MNDVSARLASLRTRMAQTGTDLVVLGPAAHMSWLLGFHPHADERPCLLLVGPEREAFVMPALNADGSRELTDIAFHTWSDDEGPEAALRAALSDVGISEAATVSLDETMRADFALLLLDALPGANRSFAAETVGALRLQKDDGEHGELKANAAIADAAMLAAFAAIRPGHSETEIADIARKVFADHGAKPMFAIVGAGGNGAFPHHQTGDTLIRDGDAIVMDIGGRKGSYSSDITRMAVVGDGPAGYLEVHAIVEAAVSAALTAAKPGIPAKAVDAAARSTIGEAGFAEFFVHRTGHGLGVEGHEPPWITATSETILQPGMVFSIEPGIYLPGRFGVRLEEIVILRDDGPEIYSGLPRDVHIAGT